MSRQLPQYKIEWDGKVYYADNGAFLDLKVRDVLSRGSVPTITVETQPDELETTEAEKR